jgi:hypothetical protein
LSGTRAGPDLLSALGKSTTVRLHSFAIARCTRLTSQSIRDFLVGSPVSSKITELSLYGDTTFPTPLTEDDLRDIISQAPSFVSGEMVYLDISSAPLTQELLLEVFKPQPRLRSLGLSYIPMLPLNAVAKFVKDKTPQIEILTLVGTSPELDCGMRLGTGPPRPTPMQGSVALHTQIIRPLCSSLLSFSHSTTNSWRPSPPPTRLRVIELATPLLSGLGLGAGSWRIVRSKGGRGWYVDTASGWVASCDQRKMADSCEGSTLRRDLDPGHPLRVQMEQWADANGNVNSGVGWHARKMEVSTFAAFGLQRSDGYLSRFSMGKECWGVRTVYTAPSLLHTKVNASITSSRIHSSLHWPMFSKDVWAALVRPVTIDLIFYCVFIFVAVCCPCII